MPWGTGRTAELMRIAEEVPMDERIEREYQNLIERLKLPQNEMLYRDYSLTPSEMPNGDELWHTMSTIRVHYEHWGRNKGDDRASEQILLLQLIRKAHQLLDKNSWASV